ncbi:MAG: type II toxin-antitoxin system RelE/ParE family toxin [Mucilaginibacter sp.]
MEGQILEVVISDMALTSLEQVYEYGIETFAFTAATVFIEELILHIEQLSINYLIHPECRYLPTKSKMYRYLIHGSYVVIYRIIPKRVEVLNILHSSRSISSIKASRKIKI